MSTVDQIMAELFPVKQAVVTPLERQTVTLFGGYGKGKSTLASGIPGAIILDTEGGYKNLAGRISHVTDWDDAVSKIDTVIAAGQQGAVSTVVVDSMSRVHEWAIKKVLRDNEWANLREPGWGDGYKAVAELINSRVVDPLLDAADVHGFGVWFVCHNHTVDGVEVPILDKRVAPVLIGRTHLVLQADAVADEKGAVYVLRSQSDGTREAKDRSRRLPATVVLPDISNEPDAVKAGSALYGALAAAYGATETA